MTDTCDCPSWDDFLADIVGIAEIAEGLGVNKKVVGRWVERRTTTRCPEPVKTVSSTYLYSMREWQGWFALWRATRGRYYATQMGAKE